VLGSTLGSLVILGPVSLAAGLGWAHFQPAGDPVASAWLLGLATVVIKVTWAAIEEVIFRGALLPQAARLTRGSVGLVVSAVVFAFGHLTRGGAAPDGLTLLVWFLDGLGFGMAFVATRTLWMSTAWHVAKNLWVWLLFSEGTLQLTGGLASATYVGPELWVGAPHQAGLLDVFASALAAAALAVMFRPQITGGLAWARNRTP
jgi:membrane protease YdiL (CAAX protease family)